MTSQIQHPPIHDSATFAGKSIEMLKNIAIDTAEANKNLGILRIETARAAFAENSRRLKSHLKNTEETSAALEEWTVQFQGKMQRMAEMSSAWSEMGSRAIAEMGKLLESSVLSRHDAISQTTTRAAVKADTDDRRVTATMITFPERRAAMLEMEGAEGAEGASHTRSHGAAKKQSAA